MRVSCRLFPAVAMRRRLLGTAFSFAIATTLGVQISSATPVAPLISDIQHAWLFDSTDVNGYVNDQVTGESSVRITSNRLSYTYPETVYSNREVPLVGEGDLIKTGLDTGNPLNTLRPVTNATPFTYEGNQSGMNDWWNGTQASSYPSGPDVDGRRPMMGLKSDMAKNASGSTAGDNMILKATGGAVSFWMNPIGHDTSGTMNVSPANLWLFQAIGAGNATSNATTTNAFGIGRVSVAGTSGGTANGLGRATSIFSTTNTANPNSIAGPDGVYGSWGLENPNTAEFNGLPTDTWTNIIVTWGGTTTTNGRLDLYIDGVQVINNAAFNFRADLYVRDFAFGRMFDVNQAPDAPTPALVDELSIWNKRLTSDEALWLSQNSLNMLYDPGAFIPEPASAGLLAMGLVGLARFRRRRSRRTALLNV